MVAQQSQLDPKEYVRELNEYRKLPVPLLRARLDLRLRRHALAFGHLYEYAETLNDDGDSRHEHDRITKEMVALASEHPETVFPVAMKLLPWRSALSVQVCHHPITNVSTMSIFNIHHNLRYRFFVHVLILSFKPKTITLPPSSMKPSMIMMLVSAHWWRVATGSEPLLWLISTAKNLMRLPVLRLSAHRNYRQNPNVPKKLLSSWCDTQKMLMPQLRFY